MKINFKFYGDRSIIAGVFIISGLVLLSSCFKDASEQKQKDENDKLNILKTKYSITESDTIGYGVYLKFESGSEEDITKPRPLDGNMAIVTYQGEYSDGKVFDATDSAVASLYNLYHPYYVYGPARLVVGYSIGGINLAIKRMNENTSAVVLIPSNMAWGNYEPVLYHLRLLRIIDNDSVYEHNQILLYKENLHFPDFTPSTLRDTYTKIDLESQDTTGINFGDSITIGLKAFFAEADTLITKGPYGRMFFPKGNFTGFITYAYGDPDMFPITPAIDSTVIVMKKGEIREIVTGSENVYGAQGYLHPANYYIVPPFMPVHYVIELIDIKKN